MHVFWRTVSGVMDVLVAPAYGSPGFWARARTWPPALPDLSGRRYVVTGANSGIGRATSTALAARGAAVHMVCRNAKRCAEARAEIITASGNDAVHAHLGDLSDYRSVRALSSTLYETLPSIDGLIHNAGALVHDLQRSQDGLELTFATHVAGPFLLTDALVPALRAANAPRVVWVSSGGMYTQRLELNGLFEGKEPFDGVAAYAQAKRAQVELAPLWAEALAADGIGIAVMHPGWADTPGVQRSLPGFYRATRWFLRSPEQGADTAVWLAASEAGGAARGELYFDRLARRTHALLGRTRTTDEVVDALWRALHKHTGASEVGPAPRG